MKLTDWAQAVNARLAVFYNHRENIWVARIENVEFMSEVNVRIIGTRSGSGRTPDEALADLCTAISGSTMITDGLQPARRRELMVPSLEHQP